MPAEEEEHEGTWLTWPHNYGWDSRHVQRYETMYVEIAKALHNGEKVHIIAYDATEQTRVSTLLRGRGLNMTKIDFLVAKTDDVWARDNGPIFAYDRQTNALVVQDWRFNGWGNKADYWLDNAIPGHVSRSLAGMQLVNVNMVNEGGSFEVDGYGTFMAKKSSIINSNRNPTWTQSNIEAYFRKYLGVTNFIWLVGDKGLDITDDHIDGTAKFAPAGKIVTLKRSDFLRPSDYDILANARQANGTKYQLVFLPMTQRQYLTGGVMDYATYINYYVGNKVVIVPAYGDPSDAVVVNVLKGVYPDRTIVPINMLELWKDGGLVHCITQQQPIATRNS
jgi:agmatine deiminase